MPPPVNLTLALDKPECLQGESVLFKVVLENISGATLHELPALDGPDGALTLTLTGPGVPHVASCTTPDLRDGLRAPEPDWVQTLNLPSGKNVQLNGDLLAWFGVLQPASYQLTAAYAAAGLHLYSPPTTVEVVRARPVTLWTPRAGLQPMNTPVTTAWLHQASDGFELYYQQHSPRLPRNSQVAVRTARTEELIEVWPAVETVADNAGHVIWLDRRGRLQYGTIDVEQRRAGPPADIRMPFPGRPLTSPGSLPDGTLLVPVTDAKRQRVAMMQIDPGGGTKSYELELGPVKPLGPYACFWEYDQFLHFAWTTPNGWDVQYARLSLVDPASGFATRGVQLANEPILALDAYMDLDAPVRERRMLEHSHSPEETSAIADLLSPKLMLWCVSRGPGRLTCVRVNATEGGSQPVTAMATERAGDLRVHRSVVTGRNELAMILADPEGCLYYASTARRALRPLAELTGSEITLGDSPGLLTAARSALRPWVYLVYIDRRQGAIDYHRLEPADEPDPVERERSARPR